MTERVPPPSAAAVLETCLYAENLEESASFYEQVIGLEPFSTVYARHVFFRSGRGVFLLFKSSATSAEGGEVPPHGASGAGHVAFAVPAERLPEWREHLNRLGTAIEREVQWPSGGRSLYLRDPAGNSVEITTPGIWSISEEEFFG